MPRVRPNPKIDYGRYCADLYNVVKGKGSASYESMFDRVYDLMKKDPSYQVGDSFDYWRMETDAATYLPRSDSMAMDVGNSVVDRLKKNDPNWPAVADQLQSETYGGKTATGEMILNEPDASHIKKLEKDLKASGKLHPQADLLKAVSDEQTRSQQYRRIKLPSGQWISIPK